MQAIKIDNNVPVPRDTRAPRKYPFDELEVGQSFLVHGKTAAQLSGSVALASRRTGWTFTSRKTKNGVRIWRTE